MNVVHVEERGRGAPTIFIHGLASRGVHFERVARELQPARRCLLVDLPGHGQAGPTDRSSPADHAAALGGLARTEAPAHVVGASFGALVALELWHQVPDAISSLVLVDPPLDHRPVLEWARSVAGGGDPREVLLSLYTERDPERLIELMRRHPLTADLDADSLRANALASLAADQAAVLDTLRELGRYEIPRYRPRGSSAQVTVVRAARGGVCPADQAADLAAALGAEVVCVPSGHAIALSAPERLAEILLRATEPGHLNGPAAHRGAGATASGGG